MRKFMGKRMRTWQDWVIGIGGFILAPSLIPIMLAVDPPPLTGTTPTAIVLWAFAMAFATLRLPLSAISTTLTAIMWSILVIQGLQVLSRV